MLHFNTIAEPTLALLKALQSFDLLKELRLVGGTSLALQKGHRISVDIDLFGMVDMQELEFSGLLNQFEKRIEIQKSRNIHIYAINDVKVDIVNYPYHWIQEPVIYGNLKLAGLKDIAAMKLSAISGRGSKKDFVDIHLLLKEFSLSQLISFYESKYPEANSYLVIKSLSYFADADMDENPNMLIPWEWELIKHDIRNILKKHI